MQYNFKLTCLKGLFFIFSTMGLAANAQTNHNTYVDAWIYPSQYETIQAPSLNGFAHGEHRVWLGNHDVDRSKLEKIIHAAFGENVVWGYFKLGVPEGVFATEFDIDGRPKTITSFLHGRKNGPQFQLDNLGQVLAKKVYRNDVLEDVINTDWHERHYKNGLPEGFWRTNNPSTSNGEHFRHYKNGLLDGLWYEKQDFFSHSPPNFLYGQYQNGVPVGTWIMRNGAKQKIFEGQFNEQGQAQGVFRKWRMKEALEASNRFLPNNAFQSNNPGDYEVTLEQVYDHGVLKKEWLATSEAEYRRQSPLFSFVDFNDKDRKQFETTDGEVVIHHKNGKVALTAMLHEGKLNGPFQRWFDNGKLQEKGYFQNNKRHGHWQYGHSNGKLASEAEYDNDKLNGQYREWNTKGQLEYQVLMKNGLKEGPEFYPARSESGGYVHGLREGIWTIPRPEVGFPSLRVEYKHGYYGGLYEVDGENDDDRVTKAQWFYKAPPSLTYDPEPPDFGKLMIEAFNVGQVEDVHSSRSWDLTSSQLQYDSSRDHGVGEDQVSLKHGPYHRWEVAGNKRLIEEGAYIDGQKDGVWREWYLLDDGQSVQLKSEQFFKEGEPVGKWRAWSEDGALKYEMNL